MLKSANLGQYVKWLSEFLESGGVPTHYYDYEWDRNSWAYADEDFTMAGECGALAVDVIVSEGVQAYGEQGHNNLFFMDAGKPEPRWVPIYCNLIFLHLPGIEEFIEEEKIKQAERFKEYEEPVPWSDIRDFLGERNA